MSTRQEVKRIISRKEARHLTSLSLTQIDRLESADPPEFPLRIRLTNHPRGRCGYWLQEVLDFLEKRAARRKKPR